MPIARDPSAVSVDYRGRYAVITLDNDRKLNALSQAQYYDLGRRLDEIATHDEVVVTVLTARGRYFSACVEKNQKKKAPQSPLCTPKV
jgi:peroxisomal 3,2-trans-enoyl-CoA isomerase